MATPKNVHAPYLPPKYEIVHAAGLQAMAHGKATEHQQKVVLAWLIHQLCRTYDLPYFPESSRDTDFAAGKMFVGQQIVKLLNIDVTKLKQEKTNAARSRSS